MKNNMRKVIFTVTVVLLVIAFGVSAFLVGSYWLEGREQNKKNQELANQVNAARESTAATTEAAQTTGAATTEKDTTPTETQVLEPYKVALERNQDTVGWMKIPGTKVDYPIMQTPDEPDYYLDKDVDKKASKRGSLYAREVCDINEPSDNITIYGHNMADGSMFHSLASYTNKATWEKNSLIFFDTLYEYHTYKIFAVFKTSMNLDDPNYFPYHQFVDAENEADFNQFVSNIKGRAFYETGETPKYGDKLIMLSTCEYTLDNGRLVVAAYRIS